MKKVTKKVSISSWHQWKAKDYLNEFYLQVVPDEREAIKFQVDFFKGRNLKTIMLEFGCGPTVHRAIAAAPYVSEIHMGDYLEQNLEEVKNWLKLKKGSHNWNHYTRYILECEGIRKPSLDKIHERENMTRKKITKLFQVDASYKDPLGKKYREHYPFVLSGFCADSVTDDKKIWSLFMRNIASLITPNGLFFTAALMKATYYKTGNNYFPSANIGKADLLRILKLDFLPESITIEERDLPEHEHQGYKGILLAYAIKKA